jgi:hypothetical protein
MPTLLEPKETAAILGKSEQTLAWWRCSKRYDLPFFKVGGRVLYDQRDVFDFLESCRKVNAGQRGRTR